jgi:hypothetical protein
MEPTSIVCLGLLVMLGGLIFAGDARRRSL